MNSFLQTIDLVAGYKNGFKLKNISISIAKGEFVGFIGPNGSGKSTLLKSLIGFLKPENGGVFLNGRQLSSYSPVEMSRKIAYVGQKIEQADITVRDYLILGRIPYFKRLQLFEKDQDIKIVEYYAEYLGITKFLPRRIFELSGGEQQIVAICAALVQNPEIIFLDEPTAYLDSNHQMLIMDARRDLNENLHLTVGIVVHDLNLASEYCHKVGILRWRSDGVGNA
jgi:iron complex transport system ATP-binding protein